MIAYKNEELLRMIIIVLHTDSCDIMLVHKEDAAIYGVRLLYLRYIHICTYIHAQHHVS